MKLTKLDKESMRELDKSCNRDINIIKFSKVETFNHFSAKAKICYYLLNSNRNFVCEAILTEGRGRVDVFNCSNKIAIEITETESDESIELKRLKYKLLVVKVKAKDVLETDLKDLYKLID